MTTAQLKVKELCDMVYQKGYSQIVIDLVQDNIEELLHSEIQLTRDQVGAACYDVNILVEVFNPKFEMDIQLLTELEKALDEWAKDIENTNIILGIPKEK